MTKLYEAEEFCVLHPLAKDQTELLGEKVCYRLYEGRFAGSRYYVEVTYREERAAAYLGEDGAKARCLYDLLVSGTVTPCTLEAIVADYL